MSDHRNYMNLGVEYYYTPGERGCYTGNPDNRCPEEHAELEIVLVHCNQGELDLPDAVIKELEKAILRCWARR